MKVWFVNIKGNELMYADLIIATIKSHKFKQIIFDTELFIGKRLR